MRQTVLPLLQRSWPARIVLAVAMLLLITAFALPSKPVETRTVNPLPLPEPAATNRHAPAARADTRTPTAAPDADPELTWQRHTIGKGDTLAGLFQQWGIGYGEVLRLLEAVPEARVLERLKAGDPLWFARENGRLLALRADLDESRRLEIRRHQNGWQGRVLDVPLRQTIHEATGVIDQSLFLAGQQAGLSDNLIMQLAEIFGWDVDFVLDIRKGDRFSLIYQKTWKEGRVIREGPILAAEFVNQGRILRAVRYERADGSVSYFTPEGRNMRKAFLRTPVDFTRISSRFTLKRKHPVLKGVTRPHRGVDYAAPKGTPVKATGDGRIIKLTRNRGYGKHIIIQHGSKYQTVYAHLNAFRKGLKKGSRVRQGQTIGYVGMTGLASGPHLHYEFRVNGVHRNPLKVRFPQAEPLPASELAEFLRHAAPMLARLQALDEAGGGRAVARQP